MEASNGAGLAAASSAENDLRKQPMLRNACSCGCITAPVGPILVTGMDKPTSGRGALPKKAAAGIFRLLPVVAPRDLLHAPEWNDRVARFMAA